MRRLALILTALLFVSALTAPNRRRGQPALQEGRRTQLHHLRHQPEQDRNLHGHTRRAGQRDVRVIQTVSGSAVYQCQNQGGNTSPGQNKVLVGPVTTPVIFPASAMKNGNLTVTVSSTLTAPATVTGAEAGCPNPNWTGVNPVLTVTSISFVIEQPVGTPIFTCSASDPFSGTVGLTCT
jgi:hypothetical protein